MLNPDLLNWDQIRLSKFGDLDPILEMYQASLIQGIEYAIKHPSSEDMEWIISTAEYPLSFNWYCSLFNVDPIIIRYTILKKSGFAGSSVIKKETNENHQTKYGDSGLYT